MTQLSKYEVATAPCPRFKEWTHDRRGLEFSLPAIVSPVPMNIAFGPFNYEREPIQMVRCITADLLHNKYGITATEGDVCQPAQDWWLLGTAYQVSHLVHPKNLRSCFENLCTVSTPDLILCFHIIDLYRGKVKFQWWFELIIAFLPHFPRIRFLDEWNHSFSPPIPVQSTLSALNVWPRANIDNRSLQRSVWQDLDTNKGCSKSNSGLLDNEPGREII